MKSVHPYLNFEGNTEEIFNFYQSVFGGELRITRFKDMKDSMGVTGPEADKIANVALPLTDDILLMGSDVLESMGQSLSSGDNFCISLETDTIDETERIFEALSEGGTPVMALQQTEWAESFGMFMDKFDVRWMVYFPGKNA